MNTASLVPYCRSGKGYKLEQKSYDTLASYVNFILPPVYPDPPNTSQHVLRTFQPTLPQTPSTLSHSLVTSNSSRQPQLAGTFQHIDRTPPRPDHPRFRTSSTPFHSPVNFDASQHPQLDSTPQHHRRTSVLPYDPRLRAPPPDPTSSVLADLIIYLLILGSLWAVTYRRRQLLLLGRWALREMRRKWSDGSGISVLAKPLQFF